MVQLTEVTAAMRANRSLTALAANAQRQAIKSEHAKNDRRAEFERYLDSLSPEINEKGARFGQDSP